jgi:hypothetical protein
MSMTEIRERWQAAFEAHDRALTLARGIGALSAAEVAEIRGGLTREREAMRGFLEVAEPG